jgi:hypothetical protein
MTFYEELKAVLAEVNANRRADEQISLRQAVVKGLGLYDSYSTKIKDGTYTPVKDKLESLAAYLEIHPSRFDLYVRRWIQAEALTNPEFIRFGRMLARYDHKPSVVNLLLRAATTFLTGRLGGIKRAA